MVVLEEPIKGVIELKNYVDGEWVESEASETRDVVNPATLKKIAEMPVGCRDMIREATGRELPFTGTLASTDMNYQVVDGGMPCVNFGVGGPYSRGHKQDENASIDEIVECSKAVALLFMRKLGAAD